MAQGKDWLPAQRASQLEMAQNWKANFATKATDWAVPAADVTAFNGLITAADAALEATKGAGRGPVATAACKAAFAALTAKMRDIKDRYFKIPPLTNEDLTALGLPTKDKIPRHIGPSTSRPGFEIKPQDVCRISIRIWDEATGEKKRPYGMNGAVVSYGFGDAQLTSRKDLNQSTLITRSPYILTVDEEYERKVISMAMCWQTESGERGPWSEIQTATIP